MEATSQQSKKQHQKVNTTDNIESLLKRGVVSLNLGRTPQGELFIQAGHVVSTGPGQADHIQLTHQITGALPDMLNQLGRQVDHANALKTNIVQVKGGRS